MKILCIGDSLALPGHGNDFEDIWFYKLQELHKDSSFFSLFRRSLTTKVLVTEGGGDKRFPHGADCLEFFKPDIVIIQLGIVDCAPRLIRENSILSIILRIMPAQIRNALIWIVKKVKKRSVDNAYVSLTEFRDNLLNYLNRGENSGVKKVVFIKICTPDNKFIDKNPTIIEAINAYNKVFDELESKFKWVITIDPLSFTGEEIYDDGYHPNPAGNKKVFQSLKETLLTLNQQ